MSKVSGGEQPQRDKQRDEREEVPGADVRSNEDQALSL